MEATQIAEPIVKKIPELKEPIIGKLILSIIIILIFLILIYILKILSHYRYVKENIEEYQCKPEYMPFMGFFGVNTEENRKRCTKNAQAENVENAQSSIKKKHEELDKKAKELDDKHQHLASSVSNTNSLTSSITSGMSGMMTNTILNFKKTMYSAKALTQKIMLSVKILTNVAASGLLTGESIVNGPILKTMEKMCFHPDTLITLNTDEKIKIKDAKIGSYLKNGSRINGKVDVDNIHKDFLYRIKNNDDDILVTGSHLMFDQDKKRFVEVKDVSIAEKTDIVVPAFHCLITDDHIIKIGEHVFWDWED